ncbi:MAG: hypothetical protein IJE79_00350 [Alphaproteobacteria bacterium]|nr:hypothetical protein [Alphaproteobacteria bacterium]
MLNIFRVFMLTVALCVSYGALADAVDDYLKAADAKDNPETAQVFDDVKYLNYLVENLGWSTSRNQERRDLYQMLEKAVQEINSFEEMSLAEWQQQKVDDAQAEYDAARENERSTANKLLGGASMAAMGIGGMELASALSEKKSMEDAEMQMKAYLATFACDWADGKRVAGGEIAIELPGGNELMSLVGEYKTLAADLKARKESLGLKPGVESEEILDSATAGLYDDEAIGKTDGAFTSVARALSDENSEDAAEWAADKEKIENKIKGATTAVAVAAVASIAANLAINAGNRKQIHGKIESVRADAVTLLDDIIQNCNDALIANDRYNDIIIGYENLNKITEYPECRE